jgi:threonine/homoserine/homoserine lactone efflux protein
MDVLPSLAVFAAFTAASALLAITPGPDMAFFLGRTVRGGTRLGFVALSGALTGLLFHALLAAFGLSALLAASAPAFEALKIAGCGYLIWLGVHAIRHGSVIAVANDGAAARGALNVYLSGLAINLFNPKVVMFFLTFLPQFVSRADPHASLKMFILGLDFIATGAVVCAIVIVSAEGFLLAMRGNHRLTRAFDYGIAGLMGLFAGRLLLAANR